jgi:hypothetical protein
VENVFLLGGSENERFGAQDDARSRPHLKECAELAPPYQDCRENPKRQRGTVLL